MSNSTAGFPSLPPDQPLLDLRARAEQRLRLEARPAEELTRTKASGWCRSCGCIRWSSKP
ncbi:hypothetical protein [Hymenobacter rubripertinctus]|uniref:hypothetical protein n=1 Tax=Hymenobacter rubripertinctus TaxID=2029981 RepID=UPI0011C36FE1|nr:hypothetical protein [Hymenobacter rubripertinctus]